MNFYISYIQNNLRSAISVATFMIKLIARIFDFRKLFPKFLTTNGTTCSSYLWLLGICIEVGIRIGIFHLWQKPKDPILRDKTKSYCARRTFYCWNQYSFFSLVNIHQMSKNNYYVPIDDTSWFFYLQSKPSLILV